MNDTRLKYKAIGALDLPSNGKLIYSLLLDLADGGRAATKYSMR